RQKAHDVFLARARDGPPFTGGGANDIAARGKAGQPKLPAVIGSDWRSGRHELTMSLPILRTEREHLGTDHRIADFVEDMPRDEPGLRQCKIDLFNGLAVANIEQSGGL